MDNLADRSKEHRLKLGGRLTPVRSRGSFTRPSIRGMCDAVKHLKVSHVGPWFMSQCLVDQALHRVRARLVSRRTATINQIRAFLIEQGNTVRSGLRALKNSFEAILEQQWDDISPRMRGIIIGLYGDWLWLDKRIEEISRTVAKTNF